MLSSLVKEHQARQFVRKEQQDKKKQEALTAATQLTQALVDHLNVGVAQAYLNQKKLDSEAKHLHKNATDFAKQTASWLTLIDGFTDSIKELGDIESWSKAIENDMRVVGCTLEYSFKSTLVGHITQQPAPGSSQLKLVRKHDKNLATRGDFSFPSLSNTRVWGDQAVRDLTHLQEMVVKEANISCTSSPTSVLAPGLQIERFEQAGETCLVFLNRAGAFAAFFNRKEPVAVGNMAAKIVNLDTGNSSELTRMRSQYIGECLEKLVQYSSTPATPCEFLVGCGEGERGKTAPSLDNHSQIRVKVGPVLDKTGRKDEKTTLANFTQQILESLTVLDQERCQEDESDQSREARLHCLTGAGVRFSLLAASPHSPCSPAASGPALLASASFVLYNCARIHQILKTFAAGVEKGTYPALPPLSCVDWSVLSEEEEWEMLFSHLLPLPQLLQEATGAGCRIHRIPLALISLASCLSRYYSRVRILRDPLPSLLPTIHARIYFLQEIEKYIVLLLDMMGLQPLKKM